MPLPNVVIDALAAQVARWPVGELGLVFKDGDGNPIRRTRFSDIGPSVTTDPVPDTRTILAWAWSATPHAMRAVKFRKTLDKAPGANGRANYKFLGDLNTMGMEYPFARENDIDAAAELKRLVGQATGAKMRMLSKDEPATCWNGGTSLPPSNLDHVVAANHLQFKQFSGADISVRGWPKLPSTTEQKKWIGTHSDHGLLYFEVQRV